MKRIQLLLPLALATLTLGFARNANAQRWEWNDEGSARQFRSFDEFLNNHPKTAKKLWDKPQRVNDMGFLNGNKEFKQWLEDHPAAASAFHQDPFGFMDGERRFQSGAAEFSAGEGRRVELARFDGFLNGHPDIRRDLIRRPQLVDERGYLEYHPDLREFLYQHPALRAELEEHPREFMDREVHYERGL
jgi:phage-related protein